MKILNVTIINDGLTVLVEADDKYFYWIDAEDLEDIAAYVSKKY